MERLRASCRNLWLRLHRFNHGIVLAGRSLAVYGSWLPGYQVGIAYWAAWQHGLPLGLLEVVR